MFCSKLLFFILSFIVFFSINGCSDHQTTQSNTKNAVPTPAVNLHELMTLIINPSAEHIWDSAGTIITSEGEKDLSPTTQAQWQNVISSAAIIAESSNLLITHGTSYSADWLEYAQGLRQAGESALNAAKANDSDALFNAGGNIYQVCKACHNQFLIEES